MYQQIMDFFLQAIFGTFVNKFRSEYISSCQDFFQIDVVSSFKNNYFSKEFKCRFYFFFICLFLLLLCKKKTRLRIKQQKNFDQIMLSVHYIDNSLVTQKHTFVNCGFFYIFMFTSFLDKQITYYSHSSLKVKIKQ